MFKRGASFERLKNWLSGVGTHFGHTLWCNVEPCGLFCAFLTNGLVFYAQYTVTATILIPWFKWNIFGLFLFIFYNALAVMAIVAQLRCMLTDPGAVKKDAVPIVEEEIVSDDEEKDEGSRRYRRWCRRCRGYKPPRAHHCSICMRCIIKMDHHCPWVNNCVGALNHKFFLQFLCYIFLLCSFTLTLVIARFVTCVYEEDGCEDPVEGMLIIFVIMEAMLFGLFTACMMLDQWTVVSTGSTTIDRLKDKDSTHEFDFNEICGGDSMNFQLDWLLPTAVIYPENKREEFFGYA